MRNEGLDQLTAGRAKSLGATEVRGIALDKHGIELMLANQEAQSVAKARLAVARPVAI